MFASLRRFAATTVSSTPGVTPTAAAAQLPKSAPFQGRPWTAPPQDQTVGELGQVFIPDMNKIEFVKEQEVQIVSSLVQRSAGTKRRGWAGGAERADEVRRELMRCRVLLASLLRSDVRLLSCSSEAWRPLAAVPRHRGVHRTVWWHTTMRVSAVAAA